MRAFTVTCLAAVFINAFLLMDTAAIRQPEQGDERLDIFFVMRSYDGSMWHCRDKQDRPVPSDAPSPKDREAFMAYVRALKCPDNERPAMRPLKDGSEEPDVLDDGNCWVSIQSPTTKERHSFLVGSDGFHYVPANTHVPAVEDVAGKNYVRKLDYQTVATNFNELRKIAIKVNDEKRIDTVIDQKKNYLYKGNDFAIDFLLSIVDEDTAARLRKSGNNWPLSLQIMDKYYFEKHGNSAFERHNIPRGIIPRRTHLSEMSVHTLDVSPFTEPEPMNIYFVMRSYDGSMWHCRDGQDRLIPDGAPSPKDREAFMAYVKALNCPDGEKPAMRPLKDGSEEPDVLDDGNCWVSIQSPTTKERHSFMISSDGYHDIRANTYVKSVEAVPGKNYVRKLDYQTIPITFAELKKIGAEVAGDRIIDTIIDKEKNYLYKGSDYAVDLMLRIVDPDTAARLRMSGDNWPLSLQIMDKYYFEKHGNSAFVRNGIPRGNVPRRTHLSEMSVHTLDVSPLIVEGVH